MACLPYVVFSKRILILTTYLVQTLSTLASSTKKDSHENEHTSPQETTTFLFDRKLMLEQDKLIPDVLDEIPKHELFISYYKVWINFGNLVPSSMVTNEPTVLDWKTEPYTYYTVLLTGPDYPSQKNHSDREFIHWMVTNIKNPQFLDGDTFVNYIGATYVKDAHRFLFVVFKQPESDKMSFDDEKIYDIIPENKKRKKFSTRNFAKKHGLTAIASNYFWIDLGKPVPTFEPWFRTPGTE